MQQQHQQPPQSQSQPQQQQPTLNSGLSFSPNAAITTEQIQKCLDDNKSLIMAIMENQNLGKFQECAQYQAILQKNLMYLAAIADAQPPGPGPQPQTSTPQMPPNSMPQQANNYMQQHHAAAPHQGGGPGSAGVVPKMPFQLNALRTQDQQQQLFQFQQQQQQQQQQLQAHMGFRVGTQNGMFGMHQAMQPALEGNKQDGSEAVFGGGDGQGKSRGVGGGDRDS